MKFGFYLKHSEVVDLINYYDTSDPATGHLKGLVFFIEVKRAGTGLNTSIVFKGVKGDVGSGGEIPDIPGTKKIPCPYPPPCVTDAAGNTQIDFSDPDSDCYQ